MAWAMARRTCGFLIGSAIGLSATNMSRLPRTPTARARPEPFTRSMLW